MRPLALLLLVLYLSMLAVVMPSLVRGDDGVRHRHLTKEVRAMFAPRCSRVVVCHPLRVPR